jgi:hypothetical protein
MKDDSILVGTTETTKQLAFMRRVNVKRASGDLGCSGTVKREEPF